jgi:hypothetical protein
MHKFLKLKHIIFIYVAMMAASGVAIETQHDFVVKQSVANYHVQIPGVGSGNQQSQMDLMGRWVGEYRHDARRMQINCYGIASGAGDSSFNTQEIYDANRSSFFRKKNKDLANAVERVVDCDQFSLDFVGNSARFRLGRFAINFSRSLIFTPNDFFGNYGSLQLERSFKPGVDGFEYEKSYPHGAGLRFVAVAHYNTQNRLIWNKSNYVARVYQDYPGWQLGILAAQLGDSHVLATDMHTSWKSANIRAVYQYRYGQDQKLSQLTLGMDGQISVQLSWLSELYYSDQGYRGKGFEGFDSSSFKWLRWTARTYALVGVNQQSSPLVQSSYYMLINTEDRSWILMTQQNYSVSDESSLGLVYSRGFAGHDANEGEGGEFSYQKYSVLGTLEFYL